jgi:hypothetical protein
MTARFALNVVVQLTLMIGVIATYLVLARRFRVMWHPLSIIAAVGIVSVAVAVLGELLFRGGWPAVPAMVQRSAIGGFSWGLVIAAGVWVTRRAIASRRR